MTTPTAEVVCALDAVGVLEREVIVFLAGKASERQALRGSSNGWRRHRTRDELVAAHEGGHAVIAARLGLFVFHASVVPDSVTAGRAFWGASPTVCEAPLSPFIPDRRAISRLCWALAPERGWRGTLKQVRSLRAQTDALVQANWPAIVALATELQQRRELNRAQITACIEKHPEAA